MDMVHVFYSQYHQELFHTYCRYHAQDDLPNESAISMDRKKRIAILSLLFAIPVYFKIAHDPFLPPAACISVAAGAGFIAGTVVVKM